MDDALGIVLFILFISAIVGTAAGVTWLVVRLSPPKRAGVAPKSEV
jgi:NhaP-type Na+/H+ or K+/H+ antiporter